MRIKQIAWQYFGKIPHKLWTNGKSEWCLEFLDLVYSGALTSYLAL